MTMVALGEAMRTPVERPVSHRWCQQVLLSSACAFLASEMRGLLRIASFESPPDQLDFPPTSPCGNREFRADVPHRNRDHRASGAVRRVHSSFPYNVTDARR